MRTSVKYVYLNKLHAGEPYSPEAYVGEFNLLHMERELILKAYGSIGTILETAHVLQLDRSGLEKRIALHSITEEELDISIKKHSRHFLKYAHLLPNGRKRHRWIDLESGQRLCMRCGTIGHPHRGKQYKFEKGGKTTTVRPLCMLIKDKPE